MTPPPCRPKGLLARDRVGDLLERVRAALPGSAWDEVLETEPALSPPAPKQSTRTALVTLFRGDFESAGEGMMPWVSRNVGSSVASRTWSRDKNSLCGGSIGSGKGWADWESPYLHGLTPGRRYAVELSVKAELKAGKVRVFLFKYSDDYRPLDLATQNRGVFGPALLGEIEGTRQWEKRRFLKQLEPDVGLVRVYLQCFGIDGKVCFDDISVSEFNADPNLVDDCDELGGWKPGFPEAHVSRETTIVHQGDAALNFTVNVDHRGGETKYPIGWPHLRWTPSPPLDWTGKKSLTFWVHATSSRPALPKRAVNLSIRSQNTEGLSIPLTFPKDTWQQVTVPLSGKNLPAVNHIEFFVEEAAYNDGDRVTFVIDEMKLTK